MALGNERILRDVLEGMLLSGKRTVRLSADEDLLERFDVGRFERIGDFQGRRNDGKIHKALFKCFYTLRSRMVIYTDPDTGMLGFKTLENRKHENMQRDLTDGYRDTSALKEPVGPDLVLSLFDLLICRFNMREKLLAFRRQCHALLGPDEKAAAQVGLEHVDHTGDIRLVVMKKTGSLCEAPVFADIIEDLIVFPIAVHNSHHINIV